MRIIKALARFVCTVALLIVGVYTGIAAVIFLLLASGNFTPGDPMYFDFDAPTLFQTLSFICIGSSIFACLAIARHKLAGKTR